MQSSGGCCGGLGCGLSVINKVSVAVTQDYEERKPLTKPRCCRATTRCLLTVIVVAVLVATVVFVAKTKPGIITAGQVYAQMPQPVYPPLPSGALDGSQNITIMTCPCFRESVAFSTFLNFFIIDKNYVSYLLDSPKLLCGDNNNGDIYLQAICETLLGAIISIDHFEEQRRTIQTPNLLPPFWLYTRVLGQIDTNIQSEKNSDLALRFSNPNLFNYSMKLVNLMYAMISQMETNISSTNEDYWQAGQAVAISAAPGTMVDFTFGMSIDWHNYSTQCYPTSCDVAYLNPPLRKVFTAMSEVGGFLSIVMFILRVLLWPAIAKLMFCCCIKKHEDAHDPAPVP